MSKYTNLGAEYTVNTNKFSGVERFAVDGNATSEVGLNDFIIPISLELNGGVDNNLIESIDLHVTITFDTGFGFINTENVYKQTYNNIAIGLNDTNYTNFFSDEGSDYDENINIVANAADHLTLKYFHTIKDADGV